jgi:hypothetical protein
MDGRGVVCGVGVMVMGKDRINKANKKAAANKNKQLQPSEKIGVKDYEHIVFDKSWIGTSVSKVYDELYACQGEFSKMMDESDFGEASLKFYSLEGSSFKEGVIPPATNQKDQIERENIIKNAKYGFGTTAFLPYESDGRTGAILAMEVWVNINSNPFEAIDEKTDKSIQLSDLGFALALIHEMVSHVHFIKKLPVWHNAIVRFSDHDKMDTAAKQKKIFQCLKEYADCKNLSVEESALEELSWLSMTNTPDGQAFLNEKGLGENGILKKHKRLLYSDK